MTIDDEERRVFRVLEVIEDLQTFISKLVHETSRLISRKFINARIETVIHNNEARTHRVPHSTFGWAAMM